MAAVRLSLKPDLLCLLLLATLCALLTSRVTGANLHLLNDPVLFFYPMYSFLGERLISGDIPGWNPHQFSGAPFAADPQSGWMYWPAMILFSFLPLSAAAWGFLFVHWFLAGAGAFVLARALGMGSLGALVAGLAYGFNGFLFERNLCCPPYTQVAAWLPWALLGAEMALRSGRFPSMCLWWGVSGFALSQILAGWLGQGAYYALLAVGGYMAYRALIAPPETSRRIRARFAALAMHGSAVLLCGFWLAAAGLLPRFEFNALSSLAGGYGGSQLVKGGWGLENWAAVLNPLASKLYMGGVAYALALLAPVVARKSFATPYWAALSLGALILSSQGPTPLHALLYLLPGFGRLHQHYPDRVMMVFYLGTALLAGAAVSGLKWRGRKHALIAFAPSVILFGLWLLGVFIPGSTLLFVVLAGGLFAVSAVWDRYRGILMLLLLLLLLADLAVADVRATTRGRTFETAAKGARRELNDRHQPNGVVSLLLAEQKRDPFRSFGYNARGNNLSFMRGSRSTVMGLQDVQGYNPIHLARYDQFIAALNGRPQNYRSAFVFWSGLHSPLLDLLNVRYVLMARTTRLGQDGRELFSVVHEEGRVQLLKNRDPLPRVWLVHSARQAGRGEALDLLRAGAVDVRKTVLLEERPPALAQPADLAADEARVLSYEPDKITVHCSSSQPGMLVLSEIYYPAWKAYVDGKPVPIYMADHVLRAVPVGPGQHVVELRYESQTLLWGLRLSIIGYLLFAALALYQGVLHWQNRVRQTG